MPPINYTLLQNVLKCLTREDILVHVDNHSKAESVVKDGVFTAVYQYSSNSSSGIHSSESPPTSS